MSEAGKKGIESIKKFTNEEIEKMNIEELKSKLKIIQDISVKGNELIKNQQKVIEEQKKDKKVLVNNYSKVLGTFISKDKIRKIINRYENEINKDGILTKLNSYDLLRAVINRLEDLLEEN